MMRAEDINSIESESGIIASLIHNPELSFYSEYLLPNHFTRRIGVYTQRFVTSPERASQRLTRTISSKT